MNKPNFLERFTSRKFLVALGTALAIPFEGTELHDKVAMVLVALVYIMTQGNVDKTQVEYLGELALTKSARGEASED